MKPDNFTKRDLDCLAQRMSSGLHSIVLLSVWDKKYRRSPLGMFGELSTTCTQTSANHSRSQWLRTPVGVSLRALQNGFKAFGGTSPGGYLRTIRLQAAHDQLADPLNQKSVREICAMWGFFHPGRFSIAYRSAFGECPKDTRMRAAASLSTH
jgi:transcriptional regulator GlxA family with amidase domain